MTTETTQMADNEQAPDPRTTDMSPSEKLMEECCGCKLRLGRFSTSRGFDTETKSQIADRLGVDPTVLSGGMRLYDTAHESIKRFNDLMNRIHKFWEGMTLPLAQAYGGEEPEVEGGIRLLRRDQVERFDTQMKAFRSELETVLNEMNTRRESILAAAEERLGSKFDRKNYPQTFTAEIRWGFPNVEVPKFLEQLSPEIYRQELKAARQRFDQTFQLAIGTFLQEMRDVVTRWADRLGPKVTIYPPKDHEHHKRLWGAEVLARVYHRNAPELVPEGQVKIELKLDKGSGTEWLGPIPEDEYRRLQPAEAPDTQKKTFKNSTIENMMDLIAKFRNFERTLEAPEEVTEIVDEIHKHLSLFDDADDAAKELRQSKSFRAQTHELMGRLGAKLDQEIQVKSRGSRKMDL